MDRGESLGRYELIQRDGLPKLGRDSLLLAEFASLHRGDRVVDLGCGIGVLGLLLAERQEELLLDGIELDPESAQLCRDNLARNQLKGTIITGDLTQKNDQLVSGSYDLAVANPPYFMTGAGRQAAGRREQARAMPKEQVALWCSCARRLVKNGGRFALCIRPQQLSLWLTQLTLAGLEPKRLQLVQSKEYSPANLVLLETAAQGKTGLEILPVTIVR